MVLTMDAVAELAYSRHMSVILVNGAVSSLPANRGSAFAATTTKPALGATFTFGSDIELLVQDTGRLFALTDGGERDRQHQPGCRAVVEVVKSRVTPVGEWGVFETVGDAVTSAGGGRQAARRRAGRERVLRAGRR